jgi:hypothetical protein
MKKISTNTILNLLGMDRQTFKRIMWTDIEDFIKSDKVEFYIAKWIDCVLKLNK